MKVFIHWVNVCFYYSRAEHRRDGRCQCCIIIIMQGDHLNVVMLSDLSASVKDILLCTLLLKPSVESIQVLNNIHSTKRYHLTWFVYSLIDEYLMVFSKQSHFVHDCTNKRKKRMKKERNPIQSVDPANVNKDVFFI